MPRPAFPQNAPRGSRPRKTLADVRAFFGPYIADVSKPKTCTPHNRFVISHRGGARSFMLHDTLVAHIDATGRVLVNNGGFPTLTTHAAIVEGVKELSGLTISAWSVGRRTHVGLQRGAHRAVPLDCWVDVTPILAANCPFN